MSNVALRRTPLASCAFVLICLTLALAQESSRLEFDRHAILAGQIWRLWTAHLVHFSLSHLFLDVVAFLLICAVAEREYGTRFTLFVLMLSMPLLSIGLLLMTPDLVQYRGISGMATLLALASATAMWQSQPRLRAILTILGLGWSVKTILDISELGPSFSSLPQGIKVVWQAHVMGAIMGWFIARSKLVTSRTPSAAREVKR